MFCSEELIRLFRENFPYIVRAEGTVQKILSNPDNRVLFRRDEAGKMIAASVIHKNNVLLLCVDAEHRGKGIGSALLNETEQLIKEAGYDRMTVGAGDDYLAPGVPTGVMPSPQNLRPDRLYEGLTDEWAAFFRKRGYTHAWGEGNCFDMRVPLDEMPPIEGRIGDVINGVTYRWAEASDMEAICVCTDDACEDFTEYYRNPDLYRPDSRERVLIAETDGCVCGTLIVTMEGEAEGLGSVGCTTVHTAYQGRHIAANMVRLGTKHLKEIGLPDAFLGYTYSGLDKLYGFAGYRICIYYLMAEKNLRME